MKALMLAALTWLALSIAACGSVQAPGPSATVTSPTATDNDSPTTRDSKSTSAAPASDDALTGYGATREAWESKRGTSVPGYSDGTVYGSEVRDGVYEYFAVMSEAQITFYSRGFPDGTDLESAKQLLLDDFPADASIGMEDKDESACFIVRIDSASVRKATGSDAKAAFFSPDELGAQFSSSSVSDAVVMTAYGTDGADLGSC